MPAIPSPHSTSAPPHLLIPFAACSTEAWLPAMQALPRESTRHLAQLLQGMKRVHTDEADAHTLSPPHERALARAQGLGTAATPDGLIPLAALDAAAQLQADAGQAWAWITPCHWSMGRDHATLTDPAALALTEDESRALLAAMQPYFETDGITLYYLAPERWLAEGEAFRKLPTASLDRVLSRNVDAWLPEGHGGRNLRRLQNEMQMLLYTHPLNDARADRRQLPVNSFWLSGTGALPAGSGNAKDNISVPRSLALAVFNDDWAAYAQAWVALDAGEVAHLLARQRAGETVRLTLCGERSAQTFASSHAGLFTRISRFLSSKPIWNVLEQL
jgi:hypothetical protein